jgi:hypothetical protein
MRYLVIDKPETLWEFFNEYRKWCKSTPRVVTEFHGKDGNERIKPLERPLTHEGFLNWVWENKGNDINAYYYQISESYAPFLSIVTRIKMTIKQDQIEGGVVGQYNSTITARLNGLVEKVEEKQEVTVKSISVEIVKPDAD